MLSLGVKALIGESLFPGYLQQILTFIAGASVAVFAEPIRRWLFRPRLELEFDPSSEDFIALTPETIDEVQYQARYIRVRAVNHSARLAKSCRVYLVDIEKETAQGTFQRTAYSDSLQLGWSVRRDQQQAYSAVDLASRVPHFVDVISTRETLTNFNLHVEVLPFRYSHLIAHGGTYRLTLHLVGDEVKPATLRLLFKWTSEWDQFDVATEPDKEPDPRLRG